MKKIIIFLIILLFVGAITIVIGAILSRNLAVKNVIIEDESLPNNFNGYKIVLLSDLHGREIGENQSELSETILNQNPDIVILAGDLFDESDDNCNGAINLAKALTPNVTVIWVKGNHFHKGKEEVKEQLQTNFAELGVIALDNETYVAQIDGEKIIIDGLDDPLRLVGHENVPAEYAVKANYSVMKRCIEEIQDNYDEEYKDIKYKILVSHRPTYPELFVEYGYNATLSGHTHGGQLCLPFGIELIGNDGKLFPFKEHLRSGHTQIDGMDIIVTSGVGYSNVSLRTFNPPEIITITLGN